MSEQQFLALVGEIRLGVISIIATQLLSFFIIIKKLSK